jgi:hypothetical protein
VAVLATTLLGASAIPGPARPSSTTWGARGSPCAGRDAAASFEKALTDYRLLGDRAGESAVLNNLGALAESPGDLAQACLAYERSLAAALDVDDSRGPAVTIARIENLVEKAQADDLPRCREALKVVPSGPR